MPILQVKTLELSYNNIRLFNIFQKVVTSRNSDDNGWFIQNACVIEAYNFVTHAQSEMELRWHIHEFMQNQMTLHHVLKMAAALHYTHRWTLCSMLSTIFCRTSLSMLASTSQILFFKASMLWGLYLYTLSSRQPQRKKYGEDKSGD